VCGLVKDKIMYIYELGYGSYEDSEYTQLSHEEEFTQEEFEEKIQASIKDALIRWIDKEEDGVIYRMHEANPHIGFDRLHTYVSEILCEKFGFAKLEFQAKFSLFGWDDLLKGDGFNRAEEEPGHKAIIKLVQDAYHGLGLWHDEQDYKYLWDVDYYYNEEQNPIEAFREQTKQFGVRTEYVVQEKQCDSGDYTCIYIRIPREDGPRLPTYFDDNSENIDDPPYGGGRYFIHGEDSHTTLHPLWYSDDEMLKKYNIKEEDWNKLEMLNSDVICRIIDLFKKIFGEDISIKYYYDKDYVFTFNYNKNDRIVHLPVNIDFEKPLNHIESSLIGIKTKYDSEIESV
jgi:hypothetical protein